VAQLRSRGVRADLKRGWLVLDLLLDGGDADVKAEAASLLDSVWPAWRQCVEE
jgi:hypothetical protein